MNALVLIMRREIRLALRQIGESAIIVLFFVLAAVLFPFGVGPEPNMLARIAPGVVWVTALLAAMLSFERLFTPDFEDGSLEQMALAAHPLAVLALGEVVAHWLATGFLLALVSPLFALMLGLPSQGLGVLVVSLLLGTLCLTLIGAVGSALTVSIRRGGLLLSLLIIPLNVPVLIFGTAAVTEAVRGGDPSTWLALMGALAAGMLALVPLAVGAALRISLDS